QGGHPPLYGLEVFASYPKCAESEPEPGDETSLLLPPGSIVHDQRAGTELHSQRHSRMRYCPLGGPGYATVTEAGHGDTGQPAGPRGARDIPHRGRVTVGHAEPHDHRLQSGRTEHLFKPTPHTDGDSGLMNVPTKLKEQIRAGSRRRRLLIPPAAAVAVVGRPLGNAVGGGQRGAEATGDSTLPLDGGNIYVRQDGPRDAPAVVLIQGLAGWTPWGDSVHPLALRSHRVIRIDLLGHGQSAKPAGPGYEI